MYTIGQVAKIVGVSRDTIKFYEEKNLVKPTQNKENGYRQYSLYDVHDLLTVNFFREIDIEIKQIQKIREGSSLNEIEELFRNQERKLEEEIAYKRILLERIKSLQKGCKIVREHLGKFSVRSMEPIEVIGEISDGELLEGYAALFEQADSLKTAVTLTSLTRRIGFDKEGINRDTYLFTRKLGENEKKNKKNIISYEKCLYTVVEDIVVKELENVDEEIGGKIMKAAREMGYELYGVSYVNMIVNAYEHGKNCLYLEIYTPIA